MYSINSEQIQYTFHHKINGEKDVQKDALTKRSYKKLMNVRDAMLHPNYVLHKLDEELYANMLAAIYFYSSSAAHFTFVDERNSSVMMSEDDITTGLKMLTIKIVNGLIVALDDDDSLVNTFVAQMIKTELCRFIDVPDAKLSLALLDIKTISSVIKKVQFETDGMESVIVDALSRLRHLSFIWEFFSDMRLNTINIKQAGWVSFITVPSIGFGRTEVQDVTKFRKGSNNENK